MRVTLEKYGGWMAGIRQPPVSIEVDSLPEPARTELTQLVNTLKSTPQVEQFDKTPVNDAMGYTISIVDGGQTFTSEQSDMRMSAAFRQLRMWLEQHNAGNSTR